MFSIAHWLHSDPSNQLELHSLCSQPLEGQCTMVLSSMWPSHMAPLDPLMVPLFLSMLIIHPQKPKWSLVYMKSHTRSSYLMRQDQLRSGACLVSQVLIILPLNSISQFTMHLVSLSPALFQNSSDLLQLVQFTTNLIIPPIHRPTRPTRPTSPSLTQSQSNFAPWPHLPFTTHLTTLLGPTDLHLHLPP